MSECCLVDGCGTRLQKTVNAPREIIGKAVDHSHNPAFEISTESLKEDRVYVAIRTYSSADLSDPGEGRS